MNGKKAKALRKIARENTVAMDDVNYIHNGTRERIGTVRLGKCTRNVYQQLKNRYKVGVKIDEMVSTTR